MILHGDFMILHEISMILHDIFMNFHVIFMMVPVFRDNLSYFNEIGINHITRDAHNIT